MQFHNSICTFRSNFIIMDLLRGFIFVALVCGCFALSAKEQEQDLSIYFESRIISGTPSAEASHPHMVGLVDGLLVPTYICGASLVGVRSILTAAHCIWMSSLTVLRGIVGTNRWNVGGQAYHIARTFVHENSYDHLQLIKYDIAILYTSTDVQVTPFVRPIALNYDFVEVVDARVAGWGRTSWGGPLSMELLEISMPTLEKYHCVEAVREADRMAPPVWPDMEMCALKPNGGTTHGDSGSALVDINSNQQIGIVSWSPRFGIPPNVYVRISAFKDWIEERLI